MTNATNIFCGVLTTFMSKVESQPIVDKAEADNLYNTVVIFPLAYTYSSGSNI